MLSSETWWVEWSIRSRGPTGTGLLMPMTLTSSPTVHSLFVLFSEQPAFRKYHQLLDMTDIVLVLIGFDQFLFLDYFRSSECDCDWAAGGHHAWGGGGVGGLTNIQTWTGVLTLLQILPFLCGLQSNIEAIFEISHQFFHSKSAILKKAGNNPILDLKYRKKSRKKWYHLLNWKYPFTLTPILALKNPFFDDITPVKDDPLIMRLKIYKN